MDGALVGAGSLWPADCASILESGEGAKQMLLSKTTYLVSQKIWWTCQAMWHLQKKQSKTVWTLELSVKSCPVGPELHPSFDASSPPGCCSQKSWNFI